MTKEEKLIWLYCYITEHYNRELQWDCQRFSGNNCPSFTDCELLTLYLFCVITEQKLTQKGMYDFIKSYWHSWFPDLPGYSQFNRRLNRLSEVYTKLLSLVIQDADLQGVSLDVSLGDSMPIMVTSAKRSNGAKVAGEYCNKGYCASKDTYYYGVKVHILAFQRKGTLPLPEYLVLTPASDHDLTTMRPILQSLDGRKLFLDKAYFDEQLAKELATDRKSQLYTPFKKKRGMKHLKGGEKTLSTAVSRVRQPIESLFNWIEEKTKIQVASKVRSYKGLLVHIFGRLTAAMLMFVFSFLK